jgi:hypothetical protein
MEKQAFDGAERGYIVVVWDDASGRWLFRPVMGGPLLTDAEIATLGLDAPLQNANPLPPWTDARGTLPTNPRPDASALIAQRGGWWKRALEDIDGITIHHTLSHNPAATAAYITKPVAQGGKGHATTEYHFWVTAEGEALYHVDLTEGLWHDHCGDHNTHISIGMAGSLHTAKPSTAQLTAAARLVAYLMRWLDIDMANVAGHNDWAYKCSKVSTVCPGWDKAAWRGDFYAALNAELARVP